MAESNDQNLFFDPIATPTACELRVQAIVMSSVSVLIIAGLSANCVFFKQGVRWWHVVAVLIPVLILHYWFAWRIGWRRMQLLNDTCHIQARFGAFSVLQMFQKNTLTGVKATYHDGEDTSWWTVQMRSEEHTFSLVYVVTLINKFGRYPEWQPIMIVYDRDLASRICSRIATWANLPCEAEIVE